MERRCTNDGWASVAATGTKRLLGEEAGKEGARVGPAHWPPRVNARLTRRAASARREAAETARTIGHRTLESRAWERSARTALLWWRIRRAWPAREFYGHCITLQCSRLSPQRHLCPLRGERVALLVLPALPTPYLLITLHMKTVASSAHPSQMTVRAIDMRRLDSRPH